MSEIQFVCPQCRTPLEAVDSDSMCCPTDGLTYARVDGIWRFLPPEREAHYAQFIDEYTTIREAEGRYSDDPGWYQALPYHDRWDWRIRARSYETLLKHIATSGQYIADLGAGNGWLSNRLASTGNIVFAVDLLVNPQDGLGAHKYFATQFTPIQAEFDRLPFDDAQLDIVIFNGALHYATDYITTLNESLRVLNPNGKIVIVDSPVYKNPASGAQMVREREAEFKEKYGFKSDALPNENYLTYARLDALTAKLGIQWRIHTPNYGWKWKLRPIRAKLRGRREPAQFHVIVGGRR